MSWQDDAAELLKRFPAPELAPEAQASAIAWQFFDEVVYPRFQQLEKQLREAGEDVLLSPTPSPPENAAWRLEATVLRAFRKRENGRDVPPLASIEIAYRRALLCDTTVHTREGQMNLGVFSLGGTPVVHVESVLNSFAENLLRKP